MLTRLSIRDFAVVAQAELEFGPGLTVISGETGAGKSLLVDALGFLSGARGDAGAVRHGAERAELSAEFTLDDCPAAVAWLAEAGYDPVYGARPLKRVIQRSLQNPLATQLLEGRIHDGDTVEVGVENGELTVGGERVMSDAAD